MWENLKYKQKLMILSEKSYVSEYLLMEDSILVGMIKKDCSQEECMNYIGNNY